MIGNCRSQLQGGIGMTIAAKARTKDRAIVTAEDDGGHRPVDLVHLARYTMGDRDLEREVLTLFARQSDIYVARLRDARSAKAWVEAAHTLKGSARGIGAWRVADAAERAERRAAEAGSAGCRKVADTVSERVAEANRFIEDLLASA
jgi:HPt (histidine-containing phosphotransfer) domain-containing protein